MASRFKSLLYVGVIGLAQATTAMSAQAETLADAMILAYQTNPNLAAARALLRQTDEGVALARAGLRPTIGLTASASKARNISTNTNGASTGNLGLSLNQQLYDAGQDLERIEVARYNVLAQRQSLISTEQDILLNVVTEYMNVRRDIDIVSLSKNNVSVLLQQLQAANDRFDVGEVTRTDVSQTRAQLAAARSNLQLNISNLEASRQAYRNVVGKLPGSLATPPKAPNIPKSSKRAQDVAISRHPRVLSAQFSQRAAEGNLAIANKNKAPIVTGTVSLQRSVTTGESPTDGLNVGVNATKSLYAGGALTSQRRANLAALDQAKANVQAQAATTRALVNQAHSQWSAFGAAIVSDREQVRAAQIAFDGVQEEAKLGARTTLDTLTAEQTLLNARTNLISSIRNQYVAAYSVLAQMGMLTTENISLRVKAYNPDTNYSIVNGNNKTNKKFKLLEKLQKR